MVLQRDLMAWRFRTDADLNMDGVFTISDVWLWMKWVLFAPGDLLTIWLLDTAVGRFLELSDASLMSVGSGFVSLIVWMVLFLIAASEIDAARRAGGVSQRT